ncbi:MAG TPA: metallophosphoesterase [Candidatus Binatia bacterium]|nr:metallophosphoesterase [Candidatus Binatia bacterium]
MSPPFFFLLHSLKDPERTRHANTKLRYRPVNLDELGHGSVRKTGLFADSQAVVAVNNLSTQPDFIAFTGDLTHTTEDPKDRRRLGEFKEIVSQLKVKNMRFMPGEHDGSLDQSKAFQEFFGPTHYAFDYKGVHFIVLDNVSDPRARLGDAQLQWLNQDLTKQNPNARVVVFTHRPLFDLYPRWDWATADGSQATKILLQHPNVTVFYGHIHQENHHMTGHIAHHAAKSLIFPLPAPGSQPKRTPIPWNPAAPYKGLGFREVETDAGRAKYEITEFPVRRA